MVCITAVYVYVTDHTASIDKLVNNSNKVEG